ncbi:MAG: hypothetical protein J5806_06845 [Lentisphaeria bacterium]|nr:hypothetical protein [Lentisphaeria bacterium]
MYIFSGSPDLRYWGDSELLLGCEDGPFANKKIGGAAMLETPEGYLLIFHAVDDDPAPKEFKIKNPVIADRK